jgi:hypothetical protein
MGNYVYCWDSALWDKALWAFYSATWDNGVWDNANWDWIFSTLFHEVATELEKHSVSTNWIDYEWIEAGLADSTPLDEVLARLEK